MSREPSKNTVGKDVEFRSSCLISSALDLIGDKWSLLVIRDMFGGKSKYHEFLESDEGIASNILTNRLRRLEELGLIERKRYSEKPPRDEYHLTEAGRDLERVLGQFIRWGLKHLPHPYPEGD